MKRNGYNIVCELFGFGKPDPEGHLNFVWQFIAAHYKEDIKYFNKKDKANYHLCIDQYWSYVKNVISDFGSEYEKHFNCSFSSHRYKGIPIGLFYSKSTSRYEFFCYWLIDPDANRMICIPYKFAYKGGRLELAKNNLNLRPSRQNI